VITGTGYGGTRRYGVYVTVATAASEVRGQPRALIVTVFGAYVRGLGGWVSVAALIELMAEMGIDDAAVRSAVWRLKRRGILDPRRRDGVAGYSLSGHAQQVLQEGDRRIFRRHAATLADGWVVAVFSIPEAERQKRHTLRSHLTWLGFGNTAPGVWIAPAQVADEAGQALRRLELTSYVHLFRADYLGFAELRGSVGAWWDLAGLEQLYRTFIAEHAPLRARWSRRRRVDDAAAFADHVRTLTAWRRMPFLDPGLPAELLPSRWHGKQAADVFFDLHGRLAEPAMRHVRAVAAP
jgi:phenylacetic acid degradation operon negative regulatory protein